MMNTTHILSQAIEHIPAFLLVWLPLYAIYWLLGIVRWPGFSRRDQMLDRWGHFDIRSIGGFQIRSLTLISLISLFLELLLIRWVASEIRIFAYFKSLVLIACFLGFGLGCYLTRRKIRLAYTLAPLLGLVWIIELPWDPVRRLITNLSSFVGWFSDVHIWSRAYFESNFVWGMISASVAISILIPLFGLIAITFVPLGQLVGWYLENSTQGILAYSINVAASIVGIWLYTLLCFFSTPPVVWYALLGLGFLAYFWSLRAARRALIASSAVIAILFSIGAQRTQWWGEQSWKGSLATEHFLTPGSPETFWSPYQKLTLIPLKKGEEIVRYILNTNDSWFQQILDLSDAAVAMHPELYAYEGTPVDYHQYNLPYQFYPRPPKVLIAGAGMGNDVAAALRNGAGQVIAVEIDPLIYQKGKELHFEHPYQSDRVEFHIDDARSFVQNATEQFDLIVFSILDSHTTSSYYTNIRLDNYVYTVEAMEATKRLLKPDGLFVMSFSSERPWFAKRLRDVLSNVFGKPPLMIQTNVSFFVSGSNARIETALAPNPRLKEFIDRHSNITLEDADLVTDDWPYLYQQHRGIPIIVWVLSVGLLGICWLGFKTLDRHSGSIQLHFFFLGAAFMLLEVQIISKLALLFGTTWLVNSIVITTLLFFILLANLVVSQFPEFPRRLAYMGLFVALFLSYLIPTNTLFYQSLLLRGFMATALYCSPIFFAGLVFIASFRQIGFRAEAFGSNLLGSLVGGLLESLSFWIGIKALVIVAAVLYFLSFVTMNRVRAHSPVSADVVPTR